MARPDVQVIFDADGEIVRIINGGIAPDDPACNPPGLVRVAVSAAVYDAQQDRLGIKRACIEAAKAAGKAFGDTLEAIVDRQILEAELAAQQRQEEQEAAYLLEDPE